MNGETRLRLERLRGSGELGGNAAQKKEIQKTEFLFPGEEELAETVAGPCYLRQVSFPLDLIHGNGCLLDVLNCRGADLVLPARDGSLSAVRPENSLFLDIETTGLSGGAGTWVILIGLGWLSNDKFHLRQYFLRHPTEEKAMLSHFAETAAGFGSWITFNGRNFDLPMIQSRKIMAGIPVFTEPTHHVDLLSCARRLWRKRLASCSLRSLETELLGLQRCGDIPGAEIPAVYFNYLRHGEKLRLRDVFGHNALDILSMVRLLARVAGAAGGEELAHPADNYALARLYQESGRLNEAIKYLKRAACCGDERVEVEAIFRLSLVYKRRGMWLEAAALWHELTERFPHDLTPYVELAKYYEHRAGDPAAALTLTEQALSLLHYRLNSVKSGELSASALRHRLARLQLKSKQMTKELYQCQQ